MGMKVHVTGAGGFLGHHLTARLVKIGWSPITALSVATAVVHLAGIGYSRQALCPDYLT